MIAMTKFWIVTGFALLTTQTLSAQGLQFNEAMASNIETIYDEDGESSDWFEIYNPTDAAIDLSGYGVSDSSAPDSFWAFPEFELAAGGYLVVFASDKDRKTPPTYWRTVIDQGDIWQYFVPTAEPSSEWTSDSFDASGWLEGPTSIGYGDDDDQTIIEATNAVYLRKTFAVDGAASIDRLLLDIDYDDGFVAYLNGTEIARSGLTGTPPGFDESSALREATMYHGGAPERYDVSDHSDLLVEGENLLAIQLHNAGSGSSDLTIIPILTLGSTAAAHAGVISDDISLYQNSFHTDFKISSSGDSLFLRNSVQEIIDTLYTGSLRAGISIGRLSGSDELHYFAEATPGTENNTTAYDAIAGEVILAQPSGLYQGNVTVEMNTEDVAGTIYYTTDGSEPTDTDAIYSTAITVSNSTVIRARVLAPNTLAGPISSASYMINISHEIPVLSLIVDHDDFFDPTTGMYVKGPNAENDFPYFGSNFWQDWEKPVHLTMIDTDGDIAFSAHAGAKIFGAYSRGNDQKSLAIHFRKSYGDGPIEYELFDQKDLDEFSSIVLRNSGNDWNNTMLRDGFNTSLFHESVDKQGYQPAVLYINGEYWGIHNMREKVNEHFLADNHDVDSDEIEMLETSGIPVHGDEAHYLALVQYLENHSTITDEDLAYIATQMDIQNFIYYQSANIFINNTDWPGNNIKYWREANDTAKWRWIAYDTDFGFGIWEENDHSNNTLSFALASNGPDWPNPPWSTLILRRLMTNDSFKHQFVNTIADQLNTTWLPANISENLEAKIATIENEIQAHMNRWYGDYNYWKERADVMRDFAQKRPAVMKNIVSSTLSVGQSVSVTVEINNNSYGSVQLSTLTIDQANWTGEYFRNVPVPLTAIAKPGHRFVRWEGIDETDEQTHITLTESTTITAVFEEVDNPLNDLIVNEIFYKSADDPDIEDWVELYNKGDQTLDLSDWMMKDGEDDHIFTIPDQTTLAPGGFLILCRSVENFSAHYEGNIPTVGDFDFGLGNEAECVRIFDADGNLAEEVCYESVAPWPSSPDGKGASLALQNPNYDNTKASSWYPLGNNGNPGEDNSVTLAVGDPMDFHVLAYPNPFTHEVTVSVEMTSNGPLQVQVIDLYGRPLDTLCDEQKSVGTHEFIWSPTGQLSSGIYLVEVTTKTHRILQRVVWNQ
ncbi:hypothetical protein BGP76_06495 [Reichenbachiella sp. MSK19-1]|nr:hypothetical protein BGP76_06495 [Reichenbachiella sp. MSK19-1]